MQFLGTIQAVKEKNTVEMVNLVLKNASKPPFSRDADRFAPHVLTLHNNFGGAPDVIPIVARNAKTGLCPNLLTLGLDDLWIEDGYLVIFILSDKYSNRERNLWRG